MIRSRGAILVLLTGLNLLNYLDRFLVMAVSEKFGAEFHLSDGRRGWVVTAFMFGYMLTSPIFGSLGGKRARKGLIAAGVGIWSLATVLSGMTWDFWTMFAARVAVGVGEASYATLSPTIIDDIAPKEAKSRWLAVFYAAIPVGAALGYLAGGILEPRFGWRSAFFIAGGPGLALAMLTLLIAEPARVAAPESSKGTARVYLDLFRRPQYRYTVLGYVAQTFALGGFSEWAAPLLSRSRWEGATTCVELADANNAFGMITVVTGLLGTAIGGVIADRVRDDDRVRAALKVCAWSSAIAAPIAVAAITQRSSTAMLAGVGLAELAIFVSTSPTNAAVLDSAPPALRASAMAASIFAIHLLGDLISPPLIGGISDAFNDPQGHCAGAPGLQTAMYLLPIALALSAVAWFMGVRSPATRDEPITRPDTA